MNLTNICIYADGYYSNATYEENIMIRTEIYEKLKDEIDNIICYISDLDGKHSEIKAEIEFQQFIAEELIQSYTNNDGDIYYWNLKEIFKNNNLDLDEEIILVQNYLDELDSLIEFNFKYTIKKSQIDIVKKFIENL